MSCSDLEVRGVKFGSSFATNAPLVGMLVGSIPVDHDKDSDFSFMLGRGDP